MSTQSIIHRFSLVLAIAVLLAMLGCATTPRYAVSISALTAEPENPTPGAYLLFPADPETDPRDLQFQEFARTLERGLAERGFVPAASPEIADVALLLDYGVGERETETVTYVTPAFVHAGYGGFYPGYGFRGRRYRPYYGFGAGYGGFYPGAGFGHPFYYDRPRSRTYTSVNRFLEVEARRIEPGLAPREGTPLWSTRVDSRGRDGDLRAVFPALVAAASDYLGTDTGEAIEARIDGDDERVLRIREEPRAATSAAPAAP